MIIIKNELCRKALGLSTENWEERKFRKNLVNRNNWRKIWEFAREQHEKIFGDISNKLNLNERRVMLAIERDINSVLNDTKPEAIIKFDEPAPRTSQKRPRIDVEPNVQGAHSDREAYLEAA